MNVRRRRSYSALKCPEVVVVLHGGCSRHMGRGRGECMQTGIVLGEERVHLWLLSVAAICGCYHASTFICGLLLLVPLLLLLLVEGLNRPACLGIHLGCCERKEAMRKALKQVLAHTKQ